MNVLGQLTHIGSLGSHERRKCCQQVYFCVGADEHKMVRVMLGRPT